MHHVTLINSNVFQTEDLCACASPPPEPETDLQKTESMTCDDNIITSTGSTGTDRPAGEQPRSAADTEPQCALPARRSGMDSHFVVRATLGGDHVDTLIDTGATMTLIKPEIAQRMCAAKQVTIENCDNISVQLADSSLCVINQYIIARLCISDITTECKLFLMSLPPGYDVLLGMDWLQDNDVWLHPKRKRLVLTSRGQPNGAHVCLTCPEGSILPVMTPRAAGEKRLHGVFSLRASATENNNEVEIVTAREFTRREKLLRRGELSWESFSGEEGNISGSHVAQTVASAARAAKKKSQRRAAHTREHQRASACAAEHTESDAHVRTDGTEPAPSAAHDGEEVFLVNVTFTPPPAEHTAASAVPAEHEGLPTCKIPLSEINATIPEYQGWVNDLIAQKFEHFVCMEEIKKFEPHPDDEPLKIRLKKGATPPTPRRYRVPVHLLPQLQEFIKDMAAKGWIRPSNSAWSSPVLVIKKPGVNADGTPKNGWRFVIDLSRTNECIEPQQYYIPDIHEMWAKLQGSKYISLIDLKSGYWLCPLSEESRQYTSFQCPYGQWEYTVAPMGLVCSAAHFQRFIERKLDKHGLLYRRSILNAPKSDVDQALESREPISEADDTGTCGTHETESGTVYTHEGCTSVYQDDLVVMGDDPEEHKANLLAVFRVLSSEKLFVAPNKLALFCRYVRYLGAVGGNDILCCDPLKVEAIDSMPVPKTQKDIRVFLGAAGFMRRWISNYSKIISPLNELLKKGADVVAEWTERHDKAVADLKGALTSYPVLRQFDPNLPITILSDACDGSVGGAMCQPHEGKLAVVAYCSACLRGPQLNYSVQEKEAYGALFCVEKFRHYLLHSRFKLMLRTDHESLQFLRSKQDTGLVGRMARWAMKLSDYNMDISYIRGQANTLADALSRLVFSGDKVDGTVGCILTLYPETERAVHSAVAAHVGVCESEGGRSYRVDADTRFEFEGEEAFMAELASLDPDPDTARERVLLMSTLPRSALPITPADYKCDKDFGLLYRAHTVAKSLTKEESKRMAQRMTQYYVRGGLLWHMCADGDVICVPEGTAKNSKMNLRGQILSELHDTGLAGHRGNHATYLAVRRRYTWPKMSRDVENYVQSCDTCQSSKKSRQLKGGKLVPLLLPLTHGTHYSMDFLTDLPSATASEFNCCLVVVDRFSKRVYLIPTWKTADSEITAELFFANVVRHNGAPLELVSDRDSKFTANFWRALWRRMGTSLRLSSARSQSTDGQTERAIAVVEEILRTAVNYRQDNWVDQLPAVEFAINNSVAASTGMAPLFLETGRHALLPIDISTAGIAQHDINAVTRARGKRSAPAAAQEPPAQRPRHTESSSERYLLRVRAAHQRARDALDAARTRMCETADGRRRAVQLAIGSLAWLSADGITLDLHRDRPCRKLTPVYFGPYRVLEQISPCSYRIELPASCKIHDVFHVLRLKPATDDLFRNRKPKKLPPVEDDFYEVDKIVADRKRYGKTEYLIRWKGYSMNESQWIPESDLKCPKLLKKYLAEKEY